jgi:ornithine cyclodeaminase/alanine dehydrogenase-like protein (mu-crystallin family)
VTIQFIDAGEVGRRLPLLAAVDAIEAALRSGLDPEDDAPRSVVEIASGGQMLVMPSTAAAHPVVKVVTVGGAQRIQGLCLAFDGSSLSPAAVLDGVAVTSLRTAAVSALAVRHLAVPDAARLLVFGRGPQARSHVEAIRAVRPIAHVDVLGRSDAERNDLVAAADVICCCTTAREPLFDGALVAEHATVVAIGSHEPEASEVDDALVGRATVVVESIRSALREAGDVILAIRSGVLDPDRLIPLRALVHGERSPAPGAPRLFKSTGMGWEDAVTVDAILGRR